MGRLPTATAGPNPGHRRLGVVNGGYHRQLHPMEVAWSWGGLPRGGHGAMGAGGNGGNGGNGWNGGNGGREPPRETGGGSPRAEDGAAAPRAEDGAAAPRAEDGAAAPRAEGTSRGQYFLTVTYSLDERLALAALLDQTGPDAPTLCAGWQTRDLAAHVVLRERRPDAAAGMIGGPLAGYTARVQRQYLDRYSYPELVELFRSGPPRLSPFAIGGFDAAANTVEYFVHHEDVRRAAEGWTERELPAGLSDALWKRLKGSRLFLRSAPTGIVFARADATGLAGTALANTGPADTAPANTGPADTGLANTAPPIIAKNATPTVTVTGTPAELTLWSMGRVSAARVALDGPDGAVARLTAWRQ
jgi:uncharacterized protein (TIGR03085 family)